MFIEYYVFITVDDIKTIYISCGDNTTNEKDIKQF